MGRLPHGVRGARLRRVWGHFLRPQLDRRLPRARHRADQVASGKDEIQAFDNDLYHYISHLHFALSGFIASTGLAVAALSWFGVRRRQMWAWVAAVAAPGLALAVALPAHYPWGFDTIGHLGLTYLATVVFVVGAVLSLKALLETRS